MKLAPPLGGLALSIVPNNSSRYSYSVLMDDGTHDIISEYDTWIDRICIGQRCVRKFVEHCPGHVSRQWSLESFEKLPKNLRSLHILLREHAILLDNINEHFALMQKTFQNESS